MKFLILEPYFYLFSIDKSSIRRSVKTNKKINIRKTVEMRFQNKNNNRFIIESREVKVLRILGTEKWDW